METLSCTFPVKDWGDYSKVSLDLISMECRTKLPTRLSRNLYTGALTYIYNHSDTCSVSLLSFLTTCEAVMYYKENPDKHIYRYLRMQDSYDLDYNKYELLDLNKDNNAGFLHIRTQSKELITKIDELLKETTDFNFMHAASNYFKTKTGVANLYAYGKSMILVTNRNLTPSNILKLKRLQWQVIENSCGISMHPKYSELLNALGSSDLDRVNNGIKNFIESDIFVELKKEDINRTFSYNKDRRLDNLKTKITNLTGDIAETQNRLHQLVVNYERYVEEYDLWLTKPEEDHSEATEYILKNPYIKNIVPYDRQLTFDIVAPILYFDEDVANRIKDKARRHLRLKRFILETICERKYQLYTACQITFNTETFRMGPGNLRNDYGVVGHPHISRYDCLGSHYDAVRDWVHQMDYIGAFEQIMAGVYNFNFTDSIVVDSFIETMFTHMETKTWFNPETKEWKSTQELMEEKNAETQIE